jgi:hypothetical protein
MCFDTTKLDFFNENVLLDSDAGAGDTAAN